MFSSVPSHTVAVGRFCVTPTTSLLRRLLLHRALDKVLKFIYNKWHVHVLKITYTMYMYIVFKLKRVSFEVYKIKRVQALTNM